VRKQLPALLSVIWLCSIVIIGVMAPLIAPHDPQQPVSDPLAPPDVFAILGTDSLGRDFFSRLLYGARYSLGLSLSAGGITILLGSLLGLLAATFPGLVDRSILWVINSVLAIPGLLLAMLFVAGLGPGVSTVIIAVGIGGIPGFARISRTIFKQILTQDFVLSVKALGGNWIWSSIYHVLPNASLRLIPLATLHIAWAFLGTTTLTFLGFAGDPALPEWGAMLDSGRLHLVQVPILAVLPGITMSFTIIAIHNFGTWLAKITTPFVARRQV
jgi:ABC-type dipeptide/oligopeptide/nickel transport system permease subunit